MKWVLSKLSNSIGLNNLFEDSKSIVV